jgi:hypothetical protein
VTPGALAATFIGHGVIDLLIGAGWGLAALGLAAGAYAIARWQRWSTPVPVAGVLLAAAALAALNGVKRGIPSTLVVGVAVVVAGGAVVVRRGPPVVRVGAHVLRLVVVTAGAAIVAGRTDIPGQQWVRLAVAATIVIAGIASADADQRAARLGLGLGPVLVMVTAAGMFATTPDTEYALAFLGAASVVAVAGWPFALASLGPAGAPAVVAVGAWVAAVDGRGRPGAVVGALACWGLLVAEPVGRAIAVRRHGLIEQLARIRPRVLVTPAVALLHLGLVYVCSRVGGLREGRDEAAAIAAAVLVPAALAVALVARLAPHPAAEPRPDDNGG